MPLPTVKYVNTTVGILRIVVSTCASLIRPRTTVAASTVLDIPTSILHEFLDHKKCESEYNE